MLSDDSLYLFHHVFLPPKLPEGDDYTAQRDTFLLDRVIHALTEFKCDAPYDCSGILFTVTTMLTRLRATCGEHGVVDEVKLRNALAQLGTEGGFLPIYARCQNAAVLMTRVDEAVHVESWELSPRNEAVITTVGRLKRQFPGATLSLDLATFNEPNLQRTIAETLAKLSHQSARGTMSRVKKKRKEHDEDRDTIHPKMVTEFFTAFLRPMCREVEAPQIQKHTREEVMWLNSRFPWRRSALWLLIRVVLQLAFHRSSQSHMASESLYKQFMVYFMSSILAVSRESMPSEYLYAMSAKIGRRLHKLDLHHEPLRFRSVQDSLAAASQTLQNRWDHATGQNRSRNDLPSLARLNFSKDIYCTLTGLDRYLEEANERGQRDGVSSVDFQPESHLLIYRSADLPGRPDISNNGYEVYNLAAFEDWVVTSLDGWLTSNMHEDSTCGQLADLITWYHTAASALYSSNPEAMSIMFLTILELWIACDKAATHIHGILNDYGSCIPVEIFQSLLLPRQSHMRRLADAERYLGQRRQGQKYSGPGVFRDYGTQTCFSVRYFDTSAEQQILHAAIVERAEQERRLKLVELHDKKQRYADLYQRINSMDCRYHDVLVDQDFDVYETRHHFPCQRCEYRHQADSIQIKVHEWPLPEHNLQGKSTVFELKVPEPFARWRDVTIFFILVVLGASYSTEDIPRAKYTPQQHSGLSAFFNAPSGAYRIGLLSQVKPHEVTHRRKKRIIDVGEEDVCLANGMSLQYYDNVEGCFVSQFKLTHVTAESCMMKLPLSSSGLQQFLFRPADNPEDLSPNLVIASQRDCPDSMSLGEFKALCMMPYGIEIQWQNILHQLAMPAVVFNKVETGIFIHQIIYQAGPSSRNTILRKGHKILDESKFTIILLSKIKDEMKRIEKNWESARELSVLVSLVLRVLSLSSSTDARQLSMDLLRDLRNIAFKWVKSLGEKASGMAGDGYKTNLIARQVHLALVCVKTFDSEGTILEQMFTENPTVSIYLQCCMTIHDKAHVLGLHPDNSHLVLLYRWRALSYRTCALLKNKIRAGDSTALDMAITSTWAAYRPGSGWSMSQRPNEPWVFRQTGCPTARESSLLIHFNLLTSELLINGLPLARLPAEYERHGNYKMLFGQAALEVMPSDLPGMTFSCQKEYEGHVVHLGTQSLPDSHEFNLCVRVAANGRTWEFIPPQLLAGLFPDAFVQGFAHWYDLDEKYVEFRPIKEPWQTCCVDWRLQRNTSQTSWVLEAGGICLINVNSRTANQLSDIFQPIERPLKLHYKYHLTSSALEIDVPRLRLGFDLQSGNSSIHSRQYRGLSIDADQSLGTLVGLQNKLILVSKDYQERVVLIPEGTVSWTKELHHVRVEISWEATANLHAYSVRRDLGCLADNGSLQSKILLCYLHALTSSCVPDLVTEKTGTEQALTILRSAAIRSFDRLRPENISILTRIAYLTPVRKCYPANERVMQTIAWQKDLGFLTQHSGFYEEVAAIFYHDHRMEMFYPDIRVTRPPLPAIDKDLQKRDLIRSSVFRVYAFGAEDHTDKYDRSYTGLDANRESMEASRAFRLAKIVYDKIPCAQNFVAEGLTKTLWKFISGSDPTQGAYTPLDLNSLKYDAGLLIEPNLLVSSHWCGIHRHICSEHSPLDRFQLMIWLSTLGFAKDCNMAVLETLAALHAVREMASIALPPHDSYSLGQGYQFDQGNLVSRIQSSQLALTPESNIYRQPHETPAQFKSRCSKLRKKNRTKVRDWFISELRSQWPARSATLPSNEDSPRFSDYFNPWQAMESANQRLCVWFNNREFREYLKTITEMLCCQSVHHVEMPVTRAPPLCKATSFQQRCGFLSVDDLLGSPPPVLEIEQPHLEKLLYSSPTEGSSTRSLLQFVGALTSQSRSRFEAKYVDQLRGSIRCLLETRLWWNITMDNSQLQQVLLEYLDACKMYSNNIYMAIKSHMVPSATTMDFADKQYTIHYKIRAVLVQINHCPRFSKAFLLQQLTQHRWPKLREEWKSCIITYGRSITALQWAQRLVSVVGDRNDLIRELQTPGHSNWNPHEFPESLLLEIENGILIRDVQEQIAKEMRECSPGQNAVMQLNMGEGKSSVIVPIVVAALANGACLVRVLVAKPQSRQMLQMLVSKLGGLLGRRVYLMPISRSLQMSETEIQEVESMCRECMANGGVLLVQPEHLLSLKLMCIESFVTGKVSVGRALRTVLQLFKEFSRDVVDESDENFSVKFELIYTMGSQRPLELSPERWVIIQQLLSLVRIYAPGLKGDFPASIEVSEERPGGFPGVRLLRDDAGEALLTRIGQHICENGIHFCPVARQPESARTAVFRYLLEKQPSADSMKAVESNTTGLWTDTTRGPLLLLRGLLAQGVLAFCLGQKRWRVNYGPDATRKPPTKLAVPYRSKDSPAPRSEFSHPDVVIILTLLSYYRSGLHDDELYMAFSRLAKSDQADMEYHAWVEDAPTLDPTYHHLPGVNLEDHDHCLKHIFPCLRFAKSVIDYFVAHFVFAKELREFPEKLSASGWDIGEIKTHPTIGFSGTNDSRETLPLTIRQLDLLEQHHTNALVLDYLLQPENSVAMIPTQKSPTTYSHTVIDMVQNLNLPVQVILDVGAQILELNNLEVAEYWLSTIPDNGGVQAVVFVNESDEICVLDRHGRVQLLQISPFAKQLETCIIFLDEAHTRGIDLRLPPDYRAAVTLGPAITKDKLVQACMRMRKLGKGQSVVFCVPDEIKANIHLVTRKENGSMIEVSDVLRWATSETWFDLRRSMPLWAVQGERFAYQSQLWRSIDRDGTQTMSVDQAHAFLEPESESLEYRYRPKQARIPFISSRLEQDETVDLIRTRCQQFDNLDFTSTQLQEEQERELAPEIEQEWQTQRPPSAKPARHYLHQDIVSFVSTGILKQPSDAYEAAFHTLRDTSAAAHLDISQFPNGLLVTADFARTVQAPDGSHFMSDLYQRSVQWVLTSTGHPSSSGTVVKSMMIISPFEANQLQARVRASIAVRMHLYAPRQIQGYSSLDSLTLYTVPGGSSIVEIPMLFKLQLNLFAGQLYITTYNEYCEICDFLGVASCKTPEHLTVATDGFIIEGHKKSRSTFHQSPLKFLKVLLSQIRKDGQEIDKTHLGKILDGKLLYPDEFHRYHMQAQQHQSSEC
ncbi:hypothetical protein BDV26DRAFT_298782 [Aspergillus bertholletiae]|uniref:ubiquitinyl hydrolase 1 n=1 Tax=Aspergillus bertholletiae TaxID=1226010 RepID=A0A5N7ANM5_9EURO|nr:hypothetical protein BDV26DRAFT_298782 [Aspergillus bertholletiae]